MRLTLMFAIRLTTSEPEPPSLARVEGPRETSKAAKAPTVSLRIGWPSNVIVRGGILASRSEIESFGGVGTPAKQPRKTASDLDRHLTIRSHRGAIPSWARLT